MTAAPRAALIRLPKLATSGHKVKKRFGEAWRRFDRGSAWRRTSEELIGAHRLYDETTRPNADLPLDFEDELVNRSFAAWREDEQRAYLYRYEGRALLEPEHGYLLTGGRTLLPASMPYYFYAGLPSFARHARRSLARRRIVREERVISLRDFEDGNYYHFYNDVLGKLALVERSGLSIDAALVISRRLYDRLFFRDALARECRMRALRWLVQDDFYIEARETIFCQALPHARGNFDYALRLLDAPAVSSAAGGEEKGARVFLTRRPPRARCLVNADAVERVCSDFGFVTTDADRLTLDEQINLFSGARQVVGIHGAGLTNIIFRRGAPLDLLELFPPDQIPPHYCRLAMSYGYGYDALTGEDAGAGSFRVDPDKLKRRLERLRSRGVTFHERAAR